MPSFSITAGRTGLLIIWLQILQEDQRLSYNPHIGFVNTIPKAFVATITRFYFNPLLLMIGALFESQAGMIAYRTDTFLLSSSKLIRSLPTSIDDNRSPVPFATPPSSLRSLFPFTDNKWKVLTRKVFWKPGSPFFNFNLSTMSSFTWGVAEAVNAIMRTSGAKSSRRRLRSVNKTDGSHSPIAKYSALHQPQSSQRSFVWPTLNKNLRGDVWWQVQKLHVTVNAVVQMNVNFPRDIAEWTATAWMPPLFRFSTRSFINAISGEITMHKPSSCKTGNLEANFDFPPPVGAAASVSCPARIELIISLKRTKLRMPQFFNIESESSNLPAKLFVQECRNATLAIVWSSRLCIHPGGCNANASSTDFDGISAIMRLVSFMDSTEFVSTNFLAS